MKQRIHEAVTDCRDEMVERLQDLVRLDTRNRFCGDEDCAGEKPGQQYLEPLLAELGAQTTLFDCPGDIYERMGVIGPQGRDFSDRPNLVGEWDFGGEGPRIIINGHMDTVGVAGMTIDPFAAELRDGCVWGRGTSDCKGGLTVGLQAVKILLDLDLPLAGSLVFESVVEEESSGSGAGTLSCLDAGYTGDVAVFVDGNSLEVTVGCGGCLTADLSVAGRMGHAARGGGISAIDKALVVKAAIDDFKAEREQSAEHRRVNLGILNAGVHAAVVPAEAYLSLNIVYDVEEARQAQAGGDGWGGAPIRRRFEEVIRGHEADDEWLAEHPSQITWVKDLLPFDVGVDDPWVQDIAAAYREVTGEDATFGRMTAWSDAAWPVALGDIPAFLFGPSLREQPHGPEEHIVVDDMLVCTEVLVNFLARAFTAR